MDVLRYAFYSLIGYGESTQLVQLSVVLDIALESFVPEFKARFPVSDQLDPAQGYS